MPKITLIVGTPGAGKSSILERVSKRAKGYTIVNMGTEMLKEIRGRVKSRDRMRKVLKPKEMAAIREKVLGSINDMEGNIVIDTHASVKSGNKIIPGFSLNELSMLNRVASIIYIDAASKDILSRRRRDSNREREAEDIDEIELHQRINQAFAATYAAAMAVPIYIIRNEENRLDYAVRDTLKALDDIYGK